MEMLVTMTDCYPEAWGNILSDMREDLDWTQQILSGKCGVSRSMISHWERGNVCDDSFKPSHQVALNLAEMLAGRTVWLERPSDVVDWLSLIGIRPTEQELSDMVSNESWQRAIPLVRISRYQVSRLPQPYVKREGLMEQARKYLCDDSSGNAPLLLVGGPGTGKSTLASALASDRAIRAQFPHAVLWGQMTLTGTTDRSADVAHIMHRWFRAFGLEVEADVKQARLVEKMARWLAYQRLLIVIDNADDYRQIEPLLRVGSQTPYFEGRVIITTRNRGLVKDLPAGSPLMEVGALTEEEGHQLLKRVLETSPVDPDSGFTQEMLDVLKRNVLALAIASRRLKELGPKKTLTDLQDPDQCIQILSPKDRDDPDFSIASSYSLSYKQLSSKQQICYRALGQLPGPVRFDSSVLTAIKDGIPETKLDECLRKFVELSLLEVDGEKYLQHPLLHDYARLQLVEADEWDPSHAWVERYSNELVRRHPLWPSIPRSPRASLGSNGWRRWFKMGFREIKFFWNQKYENVIVNVWKTYDAPLEQWIRCKVLERREHSFRQPVKILTITSVVSLILGIMLKMVNVRWVQEYLIGCFALIVIISSFVAGWMVVVHAIDFHRLWHRTRRDDLV
jgi:transcriptional regulator with XRE-family HTH domain